MVAPAAPSGITVLHTLQEMTKQRISWTAASGATSYNIYRCAVPYDTFTLIGNTTSTTYDDLAPLTFQLNWFYKVSSLNGDGESALSSAYSLEDFAFAQIAFRDATRRITDSTTFQSEYYSDEDTLFQIYEIRQRLDNILQFGGEEMWLYKRYYNPAEGVEETPERKTASYWDPIQVTVKLEPANWTRVLEIEGLRNIFTPRTWTRYYPLLANKDILVTRQNKRFEIVDIDFRRFRGFLLRQEFNTVELTDFAISTALTPPTPLPL